MSIGKQKDSENTEFSHSCQVIKLNENIELKLFAKNNFTYVLNAFKDIFYKYENIENINIEKIISYESRKIQDECYTYRDIYFNNQFAGVIRFTTQKRVIELDDFYIMPEFRNQGIGTIILKYFTTLATKYNHQIQLYVYKKNIGAERLYTRMGFTPIKILPTRKILAFNQAKK